jgi:hypothetical protein
MQISGSGEQAKVHKRQTFLPLKTESGKLCMPISSSMAFLPPRICPKKGQMVVRYAYIRWSKTLITGSGQQAKVQDSRHSYHSRQRVARYARFILVPWHSYHQKYAQKRANSGKVCPHFVVISGSV